MASKSAVVDQLLREGTHTARDIMRLAGCSSSLVWSVAQQLDLAPLDGRVHPKRAEIERLISAGLTAPRICEELGITNNLVWKTAKRIGKTLPNGHWTERAADIEREINAGKKSQSEIARDLEVSMGTVAKHARRIGKKPRHGSKNRKEEIITALLREAVLSAEEIAAHTEESRDTVLRIARRTGLAYKPSRERALQMLQEGCSEEQVLERLTLSRRSLEAARRQQCPQSGNGRRRRKRGKQLPARIYYNGQGCKLFTPSLANWAWHTASTPGAVLFRAGLIQSSQRPNQWYTWRDDPRTWLAGDETHNGWLYHAQPLPAHLRVVYPSDRNQRRDDAFCVEEAMDRFRAQSSASAVKRAAGYSSSWHFMKAYADDEPWLAGWLRRGAPAPSKVQIVRGESVERCCHAWDYRSILKLSPTTYCRWFDEFMPWESLETLYKWARWLYGGPQPEGTIRVAGRKMDSFREEANARWAECGVTTIRRTIRTISGDLCFQLWFLDSVIPRQHEAGRCRSREFLNSEMERLRGPAREERVDDNGEPSNPSNKPPAAGTPMGDASVTSDPPEDHVGNGSLPLAHGNVNKGGRGRKWDHVVEMYYERKQVDPSLTPTKFLPRYRQYWPQRTAPTVEQLTNALKYRKRSENGDAAG